MVLLLQCSFDAAEVLEHLLAHAEELQVDVHRLSLSGSSAGGGEIHYLAWRYHAMPANRERYTPVAMAYTDAQLDCEPTPRVAPLHCNSQPDLRAARFCSKTQTQFKTWSTVCGRYGRTTSALTRRYPRSYASLTAS